MFAAVTASAQVDSALLNSVNACGAASAQERLEAYRSNITGAHLNALDQAFPVTREVLGARYWQQLLAAEIRIFAAAQSDLHAYGDFVCGLLRAAQQRRPELADFPYLADLAALEWSVHAARFAPDDPVFDWNAFAVLSNEQQASATFQASAALKVLRSDFPVDVIWHAHQQMEDAYSAHETNLEFCVHRLNRFDVSVTRLGHNSANLLRAICNSASISTLSEIDQERSNQAIIEQLFSLIERGWIVAFKVS